MKQCDQQYPCSNCNKGNTECIYDQAQDGRRRAARRKNVEDLEQKRDALATLLEAFRGCDDLVAKELLRMIKDDVP